MTARAALVLGLVLRVGGAALAGDAPVTGKSLKLIEGKTVTKRKASFTLTGGGIDPTGVDPTASGATVTLAGTATGYRTVLSLAAAGWKRGRGKRVTYGYRERGATQRVTVKLVAGKLLKLQARGAALSALGGALTGVGVTMDVGALRLCTLFGGTVKRATGKKFVATNAPAPATCPSAGSTTTTTVSVTTSTTSVAGGPPTLGTQIDRAGRPGISALVAWLAPSPDQFRDQYNAAADPTGWSASYLAAFETALAVWDGIDGTCGNQFGAGPLNASRYATLAGILVDDGLLLDSRTGTCASYFALEQQSLISIDCGGRAPGIDVIDPTYSLLTLGTVSGVADGIANDSTISSSFPFLGAPN